MNRASLVVTAVLLVQASLILIYFTYYNPPKGSLDRNLTLPSHHKLFNGIPPVSEDYRKLLDIDGFNFIKPVGACINQSKTRLLVLVVSAPSHPELRQTIRETWGGAHDDVTVLFMIGSTDGRTQSDLNRENSIHKDIIQGNFKDSYRNMTYKAVMCLKFVVYHCPRVEHVLKMDDDSFVNMAALLKFIKNRPANSTKEITCVVMARTLPIREKSSKWYVTEEEYPQNSYPTYCSGWVAMFTPEIAYEMYKVAQNESYFWIDDVFVYGTVAKKVRGLKHTDISGWTLPPTKVSEGYCDNSTFLFGGPNLGANEIRDCWKVLRSTAVPGIKLG